MRNCRSIVPLISVLLLQVLVAQQVASWQEKMDEGRRVREQNRFAEAEQSFNPPLRWQKDSAARIDAMPPA